MTEADPDSAEAERDAIMAAISMGRACMDLLADLMLMSARTNAEPMKRFVNEEIERAETDFAKPLPLTSDFGDVIAKQAIGFRLDILQRVFAEAGNKP
jgi:hypothetical protein